MSDKPNLEGLLPCPFCGEWYELQRPATPQDDGRTYHRIRCKTCHALGPVEESEDEAVAAWNRREKRPEA